MVVLFHSLFFFRKRVVFFQLTSHKGTCKGNKAIVVILCLLLTSSSANSYILIFFYEISGPDRTKVGRNGHWMVLYKIMFQSEINHMYRSKRLQGVKKGVFWGVFCWAFIFQPVLIFVYVPYNFLFKCVIPLDFAWLFLGFFSL